MLTSNAKWLALGLMAFGFSLRCLGYLDAWPNPDEGAYYAIATSGSWNAFTSEIAHHPHPPGIYVLHWWLGQAGELGTSLAWLRLPSLLGGSAAIYGVFLLGREIGGDRVGHRAAVAAGDGARRVHEGRAAGIPMLLAVVVGTTCFVHGGLWASCGGSARAGPPGAA